MSNLNLELALAQARRLPTTARELGVLYKSGLAPLNDPAGSINALLSMRRWGMVGGAIRIAASRHPDVIGLVDEIGELTFADLDRRSNSLARAWKQRGLDDKSVIAVLCRDHRGLVESMFAAGKLGAKLLLMNTGFAKPQFAAVAEREGVDILVYDIEFAGILEDIPDSIPRYLAWVDDDDNPYETLEQLITSAPGDELPRPETIGGLVLLTSGTTGTPKGAPRQVSSPFAAAQFLDRIPLRPEQRTFMAAPLFHGTGLSQFMLTISLGSTSVLRRRFDPLKTLEAMAKYKVEGLVVVPTMLQRILNLGDDVIKQYDLSALRIVFCAGSALPTEVGTHAMELWGDVIYNLYGSTEVAVATVATPEDWKKAPGTVGRSPVGCKVTLYDEKNKPITEPNTIGRVFVGSGLRFSGYTGGGTKDELDGLLSSGDVGHFDEDGLLFIDGRDDDMIVSGGENVFPAEVEDLLIEQPAIADAAVIGVPDEDFGQRLKAFVVLRDGQSISADEVKDLIKTNLARHKVPREVEFVDDLPRNATGKLLRKQLS
ncbi:acyl-CoA synthetase [Jatrophihabitans sp.]|uniref:acyl-CoA synthetase n=1 Tax=Jatrophihabitans sp. TaxID=1932789 RepID=UPI0030C73A94|nr:Long-chain-fatty-acid--CoA ligase [Jatrophihabitans sp.]